MSYKPEVMTGGSAKWAGNSLRFATPQEAKDWVFDLSMRWLAVSETRVVDSEDPVNYRWVDGKMEPVDGNR